ncbi:FkbM family methyltransferase [uncultured Muriicola sp.]|uniref:FkbM family methyltransferase n=1 Tax=uncultured Muriicola sp. TaxID=1583102 RepID=UPI0026234D8E|nr:FkbM family methyltransferase [uncultured Muriicola sp.]
MLKKLRLFVGGFYFTHFKKVYKKNNLVIHIPYDLTDYVFRGRFVYNSYEEEEARYLSQYLPPKARVLELGACLGYVSCLTNQLLDDPTKHVVLEANPNLIPSLERNKKENHCAFHIENVVIANQKSIDFYVHDLIVGGSSKRTTQNKITVAGVDFAWIIKKYGFEFDTLILDIEGGELELFRNFADDIAKFDNIYVELHPFANILTNEEAQECENILSSLGFTLIVRDGNFQIWEK